MKKLLAIIALMVSITANAYDFMVDGIAYNVTSRENRTVEVTSNENAYSGNIVIPESVLYSGYNYAVTSIGKQAFQFCHNLSSVIIANSVLSIGQQAFNTCTGLETIEFSNSLTSIGDQAFYWCQSLTSINIPNSVESIGFNAFCGCSGLTTLDIPNSVTIIGSRAFSYCSNLLSVTIPSSVISIGNMAFTNCTNLENIYVFWHIPLDIDADVFENVPKTTCKLYVPRGAKNTYKKAEGWKEIWNIIEQDEPYEPITEVRKWDFTSVYGTNAQAETTEAPEYWGTEANKGRMTYQQEVNDEQLQGRDGDYSVTKGLYFTALEKSMLIGVTTNQNPYMQLGKNGTVIRIPQCKAGFSVKVRYASATNTREALFVVTNGSVEQFSTESAQNNVLNAEIVTFTVVDDGDVTLTLKEGMGARLFTISVASQESSIPLITLSGSETKLIPVVVPTGGTATAFVFAERVGDFTAFEADLVLPSEITITQKETAILTKDNYGNATHSVSYQNQGGGVWKLLIYNTDMVKFNGDSGALMKLTLSADESFTSSNYYYKNITFVDQYSQHTEIIESELGQIFTNMPLTPGDVNRDGMLTVADMTGTINFIIDENTEGLSLAAADMDNNNRILVNDLKEVTDLVLAANPENAVQMAKGEDYDDFGSDIRLQSTNLLQDEQSEVSLLLNNNYSEYTGLQFDMTLPEGLSLKDILVGNGAINHDIVQSDKENGTVRIVAYSMSSEAFSNAEVLKLVLNTDAGIVDREYEVLLSNISVSTPKAQNIELRDCKAVLEVGETTGINKVDNLKFIIHNAELYNIQGVRVNENYKGIVISNGKKHVLK